MQYLNGFGNEFSSEDPRCPGALPKGQVHSYIVNLGNVNEHSFSYYVVCHTKSMLLVCLSYDGDHFCLLSAAFSIRFNLVTYVPMPYSMAARILRSLCHDVCM